MKTTQRLLVTVMMTTLGIYSYAQNTLPTTGNVGIGTTAPVTEFQVEGTSTLSKAIIRDTAYFEKPVIIKDSLTLEKKLTVEQDLRIKGKTVVDDNLRAKSNIVIDGNTRMKGNAIAEGNFRLLSLSDSTLSEERFLMIKPNGKVETMEKGGLLSDIYGVGDNDNSGSSSCLIIGDDENNNVLYSVPIWKAEGGVGQQTGFLYTGVDCPAKVGIGTDIPVSTIDVRGSGRFNGDVGIGTNINSSPIAKLDVRGNVAIGFPINAYNVSAYPSGYKLAVNGKVIAVGVKVEHYNDWGDYVFYDNYKLMDLKEVESYVDENCHLPGIPSAEEIEKKGYELQEMDAMMIEKIENLYLYLFELSKENAALKREVELIKQQK